ELRRAPAGLRAPRPVPAGHPAGLRGAGARLRVPTRCDLTRRVHVVPGRRDPWEPTAAAEGPRGGARRARREPRLHPATAGAVPGEPRTTGPADDPRRDGAPVSRWPADQRTARHRTVIHSIKSGGGLSGSTGPVPPARISASAHTCVEALARRGVRVTPGNRTGGRAPRVTRTPAFAAGSTRPRYTAAP